MYERSENILITTVTGNCRVKAGERSWNRLKYLYYRFKSFDYIPHYDEWAIQNVWAGSVFFGFLFYKDEPIDFVDDRLEIEKIDVRMTIEVYCIPVTLGDTS